ncbi:MAG: DsbA family protein [Candidatus Micrarchaeia archaeon]
MQKKSISKAQRNIEKKEPVFIVKPASKRFGLDYLHVGLIVLVAILIALAFALAFFKQATIVENCPYGIVNGTCAHLPYTNSQVLQAVGKILASYESVNTSLSLLPYYSLINQSKIFYLENSSEWFVEVPFVDPYISNTIYNFSIVLNSNLTLKQAYLQALKPVYYTNDSVVSSGVISMYGKTLCTTSKPIPVYLVVDPYAPSAMKALELASRVQKDYNATLNVSYDFVFSSYAQSFYNQYGVEYTQNIAKYEFCAYKQGKIGSFVSNLSSVFDGYPLSNSTLSVIASDSGLNMSMLSSCISTAYTPLAYQAQLANFYNVVSTPTFIVNCKYLAIPATLNNSIHYALSEIG